MSIGGAISFDPLPGGGIPPIEDVRASASHTFSSLDVRWQLGPPGTKEIRNENVRF